MAQNMRREVRLIRDEHGVPRGMSGMVLRIYAKVKRQLQKLRYRGKIDLVPGTWKMRSHMRAQTTFSSNAGVDRL